MKTIRALALASVLFASLVASAVSAQEGGSGGGRESPADSRATAFQAVQGPTTEDVPGGPLLIGAYGTILVLLLGYVGWLARLQSTTSRDLDRLQKALEKAGAAAPDVSTER